jgi:tRNA(adenine34) deaminase
VEFLHDERFMREAVAEAKLAARGGEVPVGAVVVRGGVIIARAHNEKEASGDPTAHAELLALRRAALGGVRYLDDCALYVTLEPCPMCAGACVNARLGAVFFGAYDGKAGACGTLYNIASDPRLNHRCTVAGGILADECAELLSRFFADRRAEKNR